MKEKLVEHYGVDLTISGGTGKKDIFTYLSKVSSILRDYYEKPKDVDIELQKILLIEAAASLISSEIKMLISTTKDIYPSLEQLARKSSFQHVPPSLRLLLLKMFSGVEAENRSHCSTSSTFQIQIPYRHPTCLRIQFFL